MTWPLDIDFADKELAQAILATWQEVTEAVAVEPYLFPEVKVALAKVIVGSRYAAEYILKHPEWLRGNVESGDLFTVYQPLEMLSHVRAALIGSETDERLMVALRQVRHREMVRIIWRDMSGWASLEETLLDVSNLADACIAEASEFAYQDQVNRVGQPCSELGEKQPFVVIGMGKLGAFELNFSSDIDLIFAFPRVGETQAESSVPNVTFFNKVGQQLIKLLDTTTEHGFVFRVDVRLRPFGDSGPLVMSFDALESYYQGTAREWERYAMVKARVIVGGEEASAEFSELLQPFVYRRYLDFNVLPALREMKGMITAEANRKGMSHSIKLGWGGIREVEFVGQVFQLIRGGREPSLQVRPIIEVLDALQVIGILQGETVIALKQGYAYLRRTENHIQMLSDQQTHLLPNGSALERLAISMGCDNIADFEALLDGHRESVHQCFADVFAEEWRPDADIQWLQMWQGQALDLSLVWGYLDATDARRQLLLFRESRAYRVMSEVGRQKLDLLMPKFLSELSLEPPASESLPRFLTLFEAISGRVSYLSLLSDNASARQHFIRLASSSEWIMSLLTRFPLLMDELLDSRQLYHPPDRDGLVNEMAILLSRVDGGDLELQMEQVRLFVFANKLRIAAADVTDALPLMEVSDQLSLVAEVTLQAVVSLVRKTLSSRYGEPAVVVDGVEKMVDFGVVAYGKLGGLELSYGSDLDVVFLYDDLGCECFSNGAERVSGQWFFVRMAQKIMHFLQTNMGSGIAYEIDVRLRPDGDSGVLVSKLSRYEAYQREEAWTWEHQALVRARMVVGGQALQGDFERVRKSILTQPRDHSLLCADVSKMRAKMQDELGDHRADWFHLKQDSGGVADIEFMVQYCVLRYAEFYHQLADSTDNIRTLARLAEIGILSLAASERLAEAYRTYRSVIHLHALSNQSVVIPATTFATLRVDVTKIWQQLFDCDTQNEGDAENVDG
ncbi:MAG: bifunctional [glutamate--ammonia ligase]-adenylyl-L-tyrosine phosphorylase/[glutamate--ammonia-ligase] adenylyltransferase [Methylococcales bacterium]|nr:bifunctional [glutamate--ammonia ligase]-adenylyl-L-tyrosine phosphorylase/[glutamate--ammonia-ligase] adenylyltransferase [Methylococcales bacterium]